MTAVPAATRGHFSALCAPLDVVVGAAGSRSVKQAPGMDRGAGEAIFVIARTAGWLAHALEEFDQGRAEY